MPFEKRIVPRLSVYHERVMKEIKYLRQLMEPFLHEMECRLDFESS